MLAIKKYKKKTKKKNKANVKIKIPKLHVPTYIKNKTKIKKILARNKQVIIENLNT